MNSRGNSLQMAKDKALRDLGEAVWRQVQKGKLELPSSLAPVVKAVEAAEQQHAANTARDHRHPRGRGSWWLRG